MSPSGRANGKLPEGCEGLVKKCFVPLTAGGGIRTAAHVEQLLRCGADKVSVNHLRFISLQWSAIWQKNMDLNVSAQWT